jgi:ribose/xylose/arabinose/galactoside ABC-type transport system permease subunit
VKSIVRRLWFGPLVAVIGVYLVFAMLAPDTFLGPRNLLTMTRQTVVVGIAAIGMTLVMVKGGIDLSVGSSVALTTVVVARLLQAGHGPWTASAIAIAVAAGCGLFNGALVASLRITPFIVTLGTMSALRGIAKGLAGEQKIDADPRGIDELMTLLPGERGLLLFPAGVWITLLTAAIAAAALSFTRFGRHLVAIGSNQQTARLCGVAVERVTVLAYVLAGCMAGLAGVMEFGTLTVGDPTDSVGLELEVIAAVVIGGGSLSGGQGSIPGALIGALLLTVIKTGCTHVGLPNWVQEILTGGIIVLAMGVDKLRHRNN